MLPPWIGRFVTLLSLFAALLAAVVAARKYDIQELQWKELLVEGDPHNGHPSPRYSFAAGGNGCAIAIDRILSFGFRMKNDDAIETSSSSSDQA